MRGLIRHALASRKTSSVATLLSVVLSAAVTFALVVAAFGVQGGLDMSRARLGADLMVVPAASATEAGGDGLLLAGASDNRYLDAAVVDEVAAMSGVERVSPQFFGQTLDASCCSAASAKLIGFDPETDWVMAPWLARESVGALGPMDVVAGADVAVDYQGGGTVYGRPVQLVGVLEPTGTDLDGALLMDVDTVRDFSADTEALAPLWEEQGQPADLVSCVLVDLNDEVAQESALRDVVVQQISALGGVAVVEPSGAVETMASQLAGMFGVLVGAAALLVVATLFQLFARFFSLAWDRRSELALFRALGASKREVSRLIVGEAAVLVGGGAVVGLVIGMVVALLLPGALAAGAGFPYVAPGVGVWLLAAVAVLAVFCLVGALAVVWPLRQAGRVDPTRAMQTGDID